MSLTAPIAAGIFTRLEVYHSPAGSCSHELGGLPCVNSQPHAGPGRGCIHHSTSGVPDRHDTGRGE